MKLLGWLILSLVLGTSFIARAEDGWPNVHGGAQGWHYSNLTEIDAGNVAQLKLNWSYPLTNPKDPWRGSPVAGSGAVGFCAERDQVMVVDGLTGRMKWQARLTAKVSERSCNGLALDHGILVVSGEAGELAAFRWSDGSSLWAVRLPARESSRAPNLGAPLVFQDRVVVGTEATLEGLGELIAVDLKSGQEVWRIRVAPPGDTHLRGVSTAYPGSFNPDSGLLYWGTGSPKPLFDASGADYMTRGARPGINDYSAGVMAIDVVTGERRAWHQEVPHEGWVLDSAAAQMIILPKAKGGQVIHLNRMGIAYAYEPSLSVMHAWLGIKNFNLAQKVEGSTGLISGRRDFNSASLKGLCPLVEGGFPGLAAAFSPKTQLVYTVGAEWCMDVTLRDNSSGDALGAEITPVSPPKERARGHLDARDPITGLKRWTLDFPEPPLAAVLATAGNLVFVGDVRGRLTALEALTGKRLWSESNSEGYLGSVLSYEAGGHQFILARSGEVIENSSAFAKLFGQGAPNREARSAIRAYRLP